MSSSYSLYSDSLLQTSFGGFLLDSVMTQVVAFAFGLSTSFSTGGQLIPFDLVYVDTHSGWTTTNTAYTIPVTGTYIIALTANSQAGATIGCQLKIDSYLSVAHVYVDGPYAGNDSHSSLSALALLAGQKLAEYLNMGTVAGGTTLSGFLYTPYLTPAVVFSVGITSTSRPNAPVDPVSYDSILVNQGSGWIAAKQAFVTPIGGVYYVHIMFMPTQGNQCQVNLLLNGKTVMGNSYLSTPTSGYDTRSRGFILRLNPADELRVSLTAGQFYSNSNIYNTFTGLLIHL